MAKYIDADKIRAEIERRKKENMYYELPMKIGRYYEDRDLLSFLDTLEELDVELIKLSWYMEGYSDRGNNKEPKWIIKTGEGGPRYEENPKYGQVIEESPKVKYPFDDEQFRRGYEAGKHDAEREINTQKPVEWSEEDEKDVAHIIRVLDDCYAYGKHDLSKTDHENLLGTLKSLRSRPKASDSWKPSEEQMIELHYALTPGNAFDRDVLKELYEQLKELM